MPISQTAIWLVIEVAAFKELVDELKSYFWLKHLKWGDGWIWWVFWNLTFYINIHTSFRLPGISRHWTLSPIETLAKKYVKQLFTKSKIIWLVIYNIFHLVCNGKSCLLTQRAFPKSLPASSHLHCAGPESAAVRRILYLFTQLKFFHLERLTLTSAQRHLQGRRGTDSAFRWNSL